jgi:hypothetical protein
MFLTANTENKKKEFCCCVAFASLIAAEVVFSIRLLGLHNYRERKIKRYRRGDVFRAKNNNLQKTRQQQSQSINLLLSYRAIEKACYTVLYNIQQCLIVKIVMQMLPMMNRHWRDMKGKSNIIVYRLGSFR